MAKLYNLARMTTATTGAGTITLGAAVSGYLTFAAAGVVNGDVVDYAIKDGANSEHGTGTYTSTGTTLTRTVTKSTNGNAAINLSGAAEVFISPRAETLNDASVLTTGTLADGRLSGNVPLKNGANTFTGVNAFNATVTANSGAATGVSITTTGWGMISAGVAGAGGDILTHRGNNTGVIFFGNAQNHYLYYDATAYYLTNGTLNVGQGGLNTGSAIVAATGNIIASAGDLQSNRSGAAGQGLVFLGNSGARYLHFDGSNYNLNGAYVYCAAGRLWGTNDCGQLVQNTRLAFAADYTDTGFTNTQEPYAGAIVTGQNVGAARLRYRYLQVQLNGGGWATVGYV